MLLVDAELMGIGAPSALGTLLVQRLDAVLGTTLSQQTNIISGARPDAISQPADADPAEAGKNELIRHPRESVDRNTAQIEQGARHSVEKPRSGARPAAGSAAHDAPDTSGTASAPTRLGFAARTILALLAEFPEQAPPVAAKAPLSNPAAQPPQRAETPDTTQAGRPAQDSAAPKAPAPSASTGGIDPPATNGTTAMAQALAKALAQALQGSGLFYESHLADVAFGKRPAQTLAAEPQAQLGRTSPQAASAQGGAPHLAADPRIGHPPPSATQQSQASLTDPNTAQATHGAAIHHAPADLPVQAHLLVRQQLEVLANQAFVWQGEAWPNAPMQWEVSRRDQASANDDAGQAQHWATRIRITLPRLGEVDARLTLADSRLLMQLSAPGCADSLGAHSHDLQNRLAAAGLTLGQLTIDAETHRAGDAANAPKNVEH